MKHGSTLTEVLIATMVLSIGVLSVGTLFPLSLARSVRANQLTQSTIHRYNCEAQIEALKLNSYWMFVVEPGPSGDSLNADNHFPGLYGDDDGDGSPELDLSNGYGFRPGADGLPGIAQFDDDMDGNIDENDRSEYGLSYVSGPLNTHLKSDDQPIIDRDEIQFNGTDTKKIVIDPIGWHRMGAIDPAYQNNFGGDVFIADPTFASVGGTVLPRLNGGYHGNSTWLDYQPRVRPSYWVDLDGNGTMAGEVPLGGYGFSQDKAEELATLQDQYATKIDTSFSDISDISTISPRKTLDLSSELETQDILALKVPVLSGSTVRATFFGKKNAANPIDWSESRILYAPAAIPQTNDEIAFLPPLPAEFQIERIVVQFQNYDFTWMITGRLTSRPPTRPQFDVVIFHKRRFELEDEQLFVATQSAGNLNEVTVNYTNGNKPFARKGGWMFDTEHCVWYQIANVQEGTNQLTITLETRLRDRRDGVNDNVSAVSVAFMRGIVDVFPIGTK